MSKQTVYSRFESKDKLFVACVESKLEECELAVSSSAEHLSLEQGLTTIGDRYLQLLCDPGVTALWRLVIAEAPDYPKPARMLYESGPVRGAEIVGEFLSAHARSESLVIDDHIAAAQVFLALVRGEYHIQLMLNVIDGIPEETRRKQVTQALDKFLKLYNS